MADVSPGPIHMTCKTCRRPFPTIDALETHVMARGGGQMFATMREGFWGEHALG